MEPPSTPAEYALWALFGLGALFAGFLSWLGKRQKSDPPRSEATVSAALMDNRVVDPLVGQLSSLQAAVERLRSAIDRDHENRIRDERERDIREDVKSEERMRSLLEKLEKKLGTNGH